MKRVEGSDSGINWPSIAVFARRRKTSFRMIDVGSSFEHGTSQIRNRILTAMLCEAF